MLEQVAMSYGTIRNTNSQINHFMPKKIGALLCHRNGIGLNAIRLMGMINFLLRQAAVLENYHLGR